MSTRASLLAALTIAVVPALALAPAAGAARLTPAGTGADLVSVAPGPAGQAVLTWRASSASGDAVQLAQLGGDGAFGPVQTTLQAAAIGPRPFAALDPAGNLLALAAVGTSRNLPTALQQAQRAAGAPAFGPASGVADGSFVDVVSAKTNQRGDVAAIVSTGPRHAVLVTAPAGGAFGAPQDVSATGGLADTAAVGLGEDGALVVAYYDGVSRAFARTGAIGAPLGAPQALARVRNRPDFSVAIDAAGTVTVAFNRNLGRDAIGVAAARARRGAPFGAARTLDRGPNAQAAQAAAAGSTTAVTWISLTAKERLRVVIARGPAAFGRAQKPATGRFELRGEAGRVPSEAGIPSVAVDRAGGVLIAYPYGPFNAVHETLLRAGSKRFVAPRILSALGHGGVPAAVLPSDDRPVVAFADGDSVFAATALGRPVFTRAPNVTLSRLSPAEMRRNGTVSATARCSVRCVIVANARLTTGRGRPDQVISRQARPPRTLAANTPLRLTFGLTDKGRAALAATGRAQAKVLVTAANVSGAARTVRQTFDVGRRGSGPPRRRDR